MPFPLDRGSPSLPVAVDLGQHGCLPSFAPPILAGGRPAHPECDFWGKAVVSSKRAEA